jgi:ABC-type lipoprotein release transport system permease subunit
MNAWIERQRGLIDFAVANLGRRRGRNLGLFLAYTLVVFLLASVVLYGDALRREARQLLADAPELVVQRLTAGRHDLMPADWADKLHGLRGVGAVAGRLWGYHYDPAVAANFTLLVPAAEAPARGRVKLGAALARTRGLGTGDVLSLRDHAGRPYAFTVAGVLDTASELASADLMLLNAEDFRRFFDFPADRFTDIVLRVRNPVEVRKVAEKISLALPDTRPILREEILRTYDAVFGWRQGLVFILLTGALLAFVIFAWDRASGLSGEERREIGILKAIGWETGDVLRMKFWEGAALSLTAFLLGYLLAYVHVFYFSAALFAPVLKGWAVLYPDFRPLPFVDGLQVATLFFFSVFPYTVATIIPIWRAAITDPDQVMR